MNVNDLLKLEPECIDKGIDYNLVNLMNCSVKHWGYYLDYNQKTPRLYRKVIKNHSYDGRRIWYLAVIVFDEVACGIIQRAGREGDDYENILVIDKEQYIEACKYIDSLLTYDYCDFHVVDKDKDDVTSFYQQSLEEEFESY